MRETFGFEAGAAAVSSGRKFEACLQNGAVDGASTHTACVWRIKK